MKRYEPTSQDVLSPKQLALEFGITISKQNKLRMRKNKEIDGELALPHFKIGQRVFYRREKINEWFSKLENKTMEI